MPCGSHTKSPSATRQRILSAAYARNPSVDKQVKSGIIVWILLRLPMLILAFMLRLVIWLLIRLIALSAYIAADGTNGETGQPRDRRRPARQSPREACCGSRGGRGRVGAVYAGAGDGRVGRQRGDQEAVT